MSHMTCTTTWTEKLSFDTQVRSHQFFMDSRINSFDKGPTPKELVLAGIAGCSAMDVISLLHKYKQPVKHFHIESETDTSEGHPSVFTKVTLKYRLEGEIDADKYKEAVHLSMTKYCGVSAMISKACPIFYEIYLNGQLIHHDRAQF